MVKVYYSANLDAINWKIYTDYQETNVSYFPSGTEAIDIVNKLCQVSLFDDTGDNNIYVVNISEWKLANKQTKQYISDLHSLSKTIIFVYESASIKNKIFTELKIETVKAFAVTKKTKTLLVNKLINDAQIVLNSNALQTLIDLLPDNIDFVKNEIQKLKLVCKKEFSADEIKQIVFDLVDATVFNIVDSWLNNNIDQTIERLNDLISKNITIQAFVPIFALKLIQIKFFLLAKLGRWSSETITAKQAIPFWQQNLYSNLKPYEKNLDTINLMLDKLYDFDINVKKQRNIPYTQLIKILFK